MSWERCAPPESKAPHLISPSITLRLTFLRSTCLQKSAREEVAQAAPAVDAAVVPASGDEDDTQPGINTVNMGDPKVDPCSRMLDGDKERISLDFQGASIRNLLRIISDISGFNLILSTEVSSSSEKVPYAFAGCSLEPGVRCHP